MVIFVCFFNKNGDFFNKNGDISIKLSHLNVTFLYKLGISYLFIFLMRLRRFKGPPLADKLPYYIQKFIFQFNEPPLKIKNLLFIFVTFPKPKKKASTYFVHRGRFAYSPPLVAHILSTRSSYCSAYRPRTHYARFARFVRIVMDGYQVCIEGRPKTVEIFRILRFRRRIFTPLRTKKNFLLFFFFLLLSLPSTSIYINFRNC